MIITQIQRFCTNITIFYWKHRNFIIAIKIALFISISMIVGILTVCFTAPKKSNQTCTLMITSIDRNLITKDSRPKAIVVYDFNNDSILDIAVANSGTNNIGILLGNHDGTLSSQITYLTGEDSQPSSLALGDFNNDHQMDIVVANFGAHNIGIFFGNGNGTFRNQTTFPTGSSCPLWVTLGDFDNDLQLDIVVINYGTNSIDVLLGYDASNFTKQITLFAGFDSLPFSAVVDDFNNDDNLDIAVTYYGTHNIAVYVGNGNGTFLIPILSSTGIGSQPYGIAAADFNNDSQLDIVITNYGSNTISVLFGYGNGTFIIQGNYSTGTNSKPTSVIVGNFNSDNLLDILVSNPGTNSIGIFVGYPNGTFSNQYLLSTGLSSKPYFVAKGDFNKDGRLDCAVANYGTNTVAILLAYVNIILPSQTTYSTGLNSNPISIGVGDFNNDSLLDIVVANKGNATLGLFLGHGDGTFANSKTYSVGYAVYPLAVTFGDFNNDNVVDVVATFTTFDNGLVGIFLGNNNGILSNPIIYNSSIDNYPISIAVGDFNSDNRLDIVIVSNNTWYGTIRLLLGNGNGTFSNEIPFLFYSLLKPQSVVVADFNNDSRLDIAVANYLNATSLSSNIGIFLGNGDGSFSEQITFSTGYYALTKSIAVGDFNNDKHLDIVVANSWNSNIGIFLGYGDGTFSSQKTTSTGTDSHPLFVSVGDFNNDSRLDILVISMDLSTFIIFRGNGDTTFFNQTSYSTGDGSNPLSSALGDFNRDSLIDIAIANSGNNNIGIWLSMVDITLSNNTEFSTGFSPHPSSVAISDFNKENRLDIVVANYITNNISIYLENENGSFPIEITYATGPLSSPTSVIVADFDKDMHADIAVANSGTDNIGIFFGYGNGTFEDQTTYSISDHSHPQSLANGDFNNDSRPDIVVANFGNNNINILINSYGGCFQTEIPYYTGYGSNPHGIAIGDINNDKILDIVVANNGKSNIGVFIGIGDGTFSEEETYFIDDDSYPVAVDLGDFNNDSRLDIVVVRNAAYKIVIFLQDDNGNFLNSGSYYTGDNSWPTIAVVNDLNNDGILDITVGNYRINNIYIFIGIGDGSFYLLNICQTGGGPGLNSLVISDFNDDGRPDIATANAWNDHVDILVGHGNGTFSELKTYSLNNGSVPSSIAVGDFDNDNRLDLAVANQNADNVAVLFGYGNSTFTAQVTFSTGTNSQPTSVATGDFNNDGLFDIAVSNSQTGNVGVLLAFVNRTFFSQITLPTDDYFSLPRFIGVGHFNNDGLLDIAVSNGYSENIGIFLALRWNTFLTTPPYSTGLSSQPKYVVTGDFNNDANLDIAVANYGTNNIMILLGSGYGTILNETIYSTGNNSQPCWIVIGDLNNDNRLDIVVANSGNDNIGILIGIDDGTFSNQKTYSTGVKSTPTSVIIGNFNDETQVDIAVANYGSNTVDIFFDYNDGNFKNQRQFSAGFDSRPFALTSGDVNKDNLSDIIIANNGYGNIQILFKQC